MIKSLAKKVVPSWLWTRMRLFRLRRLVARFQTRQVRHTYGGYPLEIYLADPLGQGWYDNDWPVLPEIALLSKHRLRPGARVFDLGAHQCVVALMLARVVGPEGSVVALEANRHNAEVGRRNRELNGAEQLEVVHAAVAQESGRLTFNEGLNGQVDDGRGSWGRVEVDAYSIDDLAAKYGRPDVLFVDVEGFECHALRGARSSLEGRPDCFIEVHVGLGLELFGGSIAEVLSFFPQDHYELHLASEAHPEFIPFRPDSPLMAERFFLVALARESGGGQQASA
jgi:FkbM family methyltransferase